MAHGKRDGFSYLDGIPVKISDKVRAPRKVTLPVNFHPSISAELLTEDYNFALEHEVLANAEFRRQAVEQLAKAKVEKVASDIEDFTKVNNQSEENESSNVRQQEECPEDKHELEVSPTSVKLPPWQPTKILTPQPLESKDADNCASYVPQKKLNLADFENETSPFDYMELQTINDREELNTVFQGIALTNPTTNENKRFLRSHGNCDYDNDSQSEEKTVALAIDTRNSKVSYSSLPYVPNKDHSEIHLNNGYSLQQQVLYDLARFSENSALDSPSDLPRLRSAKSSSDIHLAAECSSGSQQMRSQTPPPVPVQIVSVFDKPSGAVERRTTASLMPANTGEEVTYSDPFSELNQEQQVFVSTLTDMGFPRDRVSRGVRQLGTDYKKVVDYLCLVQSLEDVGYDAWDTEMALHLHNYSKEEAKSFLDLLVQFQDLGFDKDLARKALVRHKYDRDKALDALLT